MGFFLFLFGGKKNNSYLCNVTLCCVTTLRRANSFDPSVNLDNSNEWVIRLEAFPCSVYLSTFPVYWKCICIYLQV